MFPSDTILGVVLISQFCVGVLGNSFLFMLYVYTFLVQRHLKKPIDVIFMHLTVVNMLTIVFTLMPDIMLFCGVSRFLDDAGCKAISYIFMVTRALSICTTCILSTFQAITITPSNSKWAWLKSKVSTWTFPSFLVSLFINMSIYVHVIMTVKAKTNSTYVGHGYSQAYCEATRFSINPAFFLSVILIRDLFFVVLMMWTCLYMVNLLYRHHKRAQLLHNTSLSSQQSPEHRATYSILWQVSCFVIFYWLNNIVTFYGFYIPEKIPRLEGINAILSTCYPTICPFLLMKNNKIILQFTSSLPVLRINCFPSA